MTGSMTNRIGDYEIIEQIGSGGMATVYKAQQARLGRFVAIKMMHKNFSADTNFLARFEREAKIIARLDHPNIVPIYDFDEFQDQPYLVMKFVEGKTLKDILQEATLPLADIRAMLRQTASALNYAHSRGVLHRDVKPSNIIIDGQGNSYLTDFGLARMAAQGESTMSVDMMIGTPQYISPEQAQGHEVDARTDVYSLGIILYELVVGRVPFVAESAYAIVHKQIYAAPPPPSQLNPEVPPAVEAVLLRALEKDPKQRYASPLELMDAFEQAIESTGLHELDDERKSVAMSIARELPDRTPGGGRYVQVPAAGQAGPVAGVGGFMGMVGDRFRQAVDEIRADLEQREGFRKATTTLRAKAEEIRLAAERASGEIGAENRIEAPGPRQAIVAIRDDFGKDEASMRRRAQQRLERRRRFGSHVLGYLVVVGVITVFGQPALQGGLDQLMADPDVMSAITEAGGNFLAPLRDLNIAVIAALLGATSLFSHGLMVLHETNWGLLRRHNRVEHELQDAYGADWRETADEDAYYRVRRSVEKRLTRWRGLVTHTVSAVFVTLAVAIAWGSISGVLDVLAIQTPELATYADLPVPGFFLFAMAISLLVHTLVLLGGSLMNTEPTETLIAREMEREREFSGISTGANYDRKKKKNMPEDSLPGVRLREDGELTDSFMEELERPRHQSK